MKSLIATIALAVSANTALAAYPFFNGSTLEIYRCSVRVTADEKGRFRGVELMSTALNPDGQFSLLRNWNTPSGTDIGAGDFKLLNGGKVGDSGVLRAEEVRTREAVQLEINGPNGRITGSNFSLALSDCGKNAIVDRHESFNNR